MRPIPRLLCGALTLALGALAGPAPATATIVTRGCASLTQCSLHELTQGASFSAGGVDFWGFGFRTFSGDIASMLVLPFETPLSVGFALLSPLHTRDNPLAVSSASGSERVNRQFGLEYAVSPGAGLTLTQQQLSLTTQATASPASEIGFNAWMDYLSMLADGSVATGVTGTDCVDRSVTPPQGCSGDHSYSSITATLPTLGTVPGQARAGILAHVDIDVAGSFAQPGSYFGLSLVQVSYSRPVPEPGSLALSLLAVLGTGMGARTARQDRAGRGAGPRLTRP